MCDAHDLNCRCFGEDKREGKGTKKDKLMLSSDLVIAKVEKEVINASILREVPC